MCTPVIIRTAAGPVQGLSPLLILSQQGHSGLLHGLLSCQTGCRLMCLPPFTRTLTLISLCQHTGCLLLVREPAPAAKGAASAEDRLPRTCCWRKPGVRRTALVHGQSSWSSADIATCRRARHNRLAAWTPASMEDVAGRLAQRTIRHGWPFSPAASLRGGRPCPPWHCSQPLHGHKSALRSLSWRTGSLCRTWACTCSRKHSICMAFPCCHADRRLCLGENRADTTSGLREQGKL